jgi:hypothetical protein
MSLQQPDKNERKRKTKAKNKEIAKLSNEEIEEKLEGAMTTDPRTGRVIPDAREQRRIQIRAQRKLEQAEERKRLAANQPWSSKKNRFPGGKTYIYIKHSADDPRCFENRHHSD